MKNSLKIKLVAGGLFLVMLFVLILGGMQTVEASKMYQSDFAPLYVPTSPPEDGAIKGVNIWVGIGDTYDDELAELGADYARIDMIWRNVEPNADGNYQWNNSYVQNWEDDIDAIRAKGIQPWIVINSPPEGYLKSGSGCQPIKSIHVDEFGDFIDAFIARYHRVYNFPVIEIFNEADINAPYGEYWETGGYGCYGNYKGRYVSLFEEAWVEARSRDPNIEVWISSVMWYNCSNPYDPSSGYCPGADWLEYMLANIDHYTGFGFHFYTNKSETWESSFNLDDLFDYLNGLANTYHTDYAFTETALRCQASHAYCHTDTFRARQGVWANVAHDYCGLNEGFTSKTKYGCYWWGWYSLTDPGWEDYHVEMIDAGGKKPVYWRFKTLYSPY